MNGGLSEGGLAPLIDVGLWDEAGWFGVAFLGPGGARPLPRVGLLFRHAAPAVRIFTDLARRIGPRDVHEQIRLAFVEGDIPGQRAGYTAVVGCSAAPIRHHRLHDSGALAAFTAAAAQHGRYLLVPLVVAGGDLRALYELAIEKAAIEMRQARDIRDPSDPDWAVLGRDA
jgi:hypothetical protein